MQARRLKSSKRRGNVKNFLDNHKVSHLSNIYNWICNILCSPDKFCCKTFLTFLRLGLLCLFGSFLLTFYLEVASKPLLNQNPTARFKRWGLCLPSNLG
jgi:hypothetical protein